MPDVTLSLVIFDDGRSEMGPLTDLRSVMDQRTGAVTNRRRLLGVLGGDLLGVRVPEVLSATTPGAADDATLCQRPALWVNGAWSGWSEKTLAPLPGEGEARVDGASGRVVLAHLPPPQARAFVAGGCVALTGSIKPLAFPQTASGRGPDWIQRPWDVLSRLGERIAFDALWLPGEGLDHAAVLGDHPVRVGGAVTIDPGVVLDTRGGPMFLGAGARIGALAVLEGPCAVMANAVIQPHTQIRPNTAIGPGCKAAGEVSGSVFQAYSNKAHQGFVGDCLVGAWCNLGANTNVSNLKNTYGPVRVTLEPGGEALDTGRTFQGPIVGDFVRTAIGTHLLTGSVVGTGSMLAVSGYPPKVVDRFRFVTDQGDQAYDMDAFFKTASAMMARRGLSLDDATRRACLALS